MEGCLEMSTLEIDISCLTVTHLLPEAKHTHTKVELVSLDHITLGYFKISFLIQYMHAFSIHLIAVSITIVVVLPIRLV
jgi:hypothetical protein